MSKELWCKIFSDPVLHNNKAPLNNCSFCNFATHLKTLFIERDWHLLRFIFDKCSSLTLVLKGMWLRPIWPLMIDRTMIYLISKLEAKKEEEKVEKGCEHSQLKKVCGNYFFFWFDLNDSCIHRPMFLGLNSNDYVSHSQQRSKIIENLSDKVQSQWWAQLWCEDHCYVLAF